MLYSKKTWSQEQNQPNIADFSCLTKVQKEKIAICFQQNQYCHRQYDGRLDASTMLPDWQIVGWAALASFAAGMAIEYKVTH